MKNEFDVIICGAGAGGMLAAVRLHDLGLRPLVIEKSSKYGGTSVTSGGGIWIPNHGKAIEPDNREQSLVYLEAVSKGEFREDKLIAYVDSGADMIRFMESIGVAMISVPGFPDYRGGSVCLHSDWQ